MKELKKRRILLLGDYLLDSYTVGKASRISPEAPVPVVHVSSESFAAGGAGNVALSLRSLDLEVYAAGRIGGDSAGERLCTLLEARGVETRGLVPEQGWPTPRKNRVVASGQQVVRVDFERIAPLASEVEQRLIAEIPSWLALVDLVAISDYGKGSVTPALLQALLPAAKEAGIPVIVDPKGVDYERYRGATVIKPNMSEAALAAGLTVEHSVEEVGTTLVQRRLCDHLVVTRSEEGISLFREESAPRHFPVLAKEVKDVTGAGDTVLAAFAAALSNGLDIGDAIHLGNIAASIAIERTGCVAVTKEEIAARIV